MSKEYQIELPTASVSGHTPQEQDITNWSICVLCQEDTSERLIKPSNATRKHYGTGYSLLESNLSKFKVLGSVPMNISLERLDDGSGIEVTLRTNNAMWHKSCFNKFDNLRLQRAQKKQHAEVDASVRPVRTRSTVQIPNKIIGSKVCFFCDESDSIPMHKAKTDDLDANVRRSAEIIQDTVLIAKLTMGDMHAQNAEYHHKCLVSLYNRARAASSQKEETINQISVEGIALAELVSYINNSRVGNVKCIFKLCELAKLYTKRIRQLDTAASDKVNTTRLKERILMNTPGLKAFSEGRDVLLAFEDNVGSALLFACDNSDREAINLAKVATFVRRDMMQKTQNFNGTFKADCRKQSVPDSLLALVKMILDGSDIRDQYTSENATSDIALSISELLVYNMVKHHRTESSATVRHNSDKETPLSIYLAFSIHSQTRNRELIDKLHKLGLCISYDRFLQISSDLGNSVCALYESEQVVCPPKLKLGVFTTGSMDNIDHNPSSMTAKDSFHGTAISLTQHPNQDYEGTDRGIELISIKVLNSKKNSDLPHVYTTIEPTIMSKKDCHVPLLCVAVNPQTDLITSANTYEYNWLETVRQKVISGNVLCEENISWAAYHASLLPPLNRPVSQTALLPLFYENAHSKAMVMHCMKVIKQSVNHLNPGQTPVISLDQPLFALAKEIQWEFPLLYGEDKFVVMMGGLHIEMVAFKVIGDWLMNSGWINMLVQANITTTGRADAILKVSHLTRTRHAHQVTAAALYILQKMSYEVYLDSIQPDEDTMEFDEWIQYKEKKYPQFQFWSVALKLQILMLQFVRSIREGNFNFYVQALLEIAPWLFTMNHVHYSRWLPVHIRDMLTLAEVHPTIYSKFCEGKFVVNKTSNAFSAIALDHNHEQENTIIKGDGGAVGLTENPAALRRWMVSGPEISRLVKEFEQTFVSTKNKDTRHHEQIPSVQKAYIKDVTSLVATIEEAGNPFMEETEDLLTLDTKEVMSTNVTLAVQKAQDIGKSQYASYFEEVLQKCSKPITDIIPRNKLTFFNTHLRKPNKSQDKLFTLKSNCNLFARLYIGCQSRNGNVEEFFNHENQAFPPSISDMGKLRQGQKSQLLDCIVGNIQVSNYPDVDVKILDGAAIVNMLSPKACKTFEDYATIIFLPYIVNQISNVKRLDLVWDTYIEGSIKQSVRETRGEGIRKRVEAGTTLPRDWKSFLRRDDNKTELFEFLSKRVSVLRINGKQIIVTCREKVISSTPINNSEIISPCNHEEADTRVILHALHAAGDGYSRIMIRTVDTDVVVLAITNFAKIGCQEFWIAFGVGKHFYYIPTHSIADKLGSEICESLPFFHAVTGCDTTSTFYGRGKKVAYETWKVFPVVSATFKILSQQPQSIDQERFADIERFIILMYSRTSQLNQVNRVRQTMFTSGNKAIENIPPTQDALLQHVKRSAFQAGHVWGQTLMAMQELPNLNDWGCNEIGHWTTIPEASKFCQELLSCGCKKSCRGLCKCFKASLACTELCVCAGNCYQN